jgi:hypothetical protein
MDFTGERFVPEVEGDIKLEHVHRYLAVRHLARGKRVLDIACGEGYGSKILSAEAVSVVGVDVDEASVIHAAATYTDANIKFLHGDIVAIPLADASVDLVVSFETLEHLTDHRMMMREIKRVLAQGGVLVVSSPDKREYSDLPNYKNPYHLRELYLSEFVSLLGEHFAHHALYGQRVHYASILAPAAPQKITFTGYREDASGDIVEGAGLPNAVYLLAVASDAQLPDLAAGLFIPNRPPYHRDISFLSVELEKQQRLVAHGEHVREGLAIELDQRGAKLLALESALAVRTNDIATLRAQLREATADVLKLKRFLADENDRSSNLQAELDLRGRRIDELAAQLVSVQAQVVAMYNSASWKFARPLRLVSKILRRSKRLAKQVARLALRLVPYRVKISARHALFKHTGSIFARTGAYQRWQVSLAPAPRLPGTPGPATRCRWPMVTGNGQATRRCKRGSLEYSKNAGRPGFICRAPR